MILYINRSYELTDFIIKEMSSIEPQMSSEKTKSINHGSYKQLPILDELDMGSPLDTHVPIIFSGTFNGFGVEIKSKKEITFLTHMGSFGKGSLSRSAPKNFNHQGLSKIIRKRQYKHRLKLCKQFNKKEVIDLISSDDEDICVDDNIPKSKIVEDNTYIVVSDSDSEVENYFENFKPKCCVSALNLDECLILSLEEAYFLAYALGCLQIYEGGNALTLEKSWELFNKNDTSFSIKYVVYHYFRAKGYVVKSGLKFGGDFLLYKDGPAVNHADYIVIIQDKCRNNDWILLQGYIRMARTTAKDVLLVEVIGTDEIARELLKQSPENMNKFVIREVIVTPAMKFEINDENEPF